MKHFISFLKKAGLVLVALCLLTGILFIDVMGAWADIPRNDPENHSVVQVVKYHKMAEPVPASIKYISWSDVKVLENGLYKVTVIFNCKNRFNRKLTKKQIILLNETGEIIKVMDCR